MKDPLISICIPTYYNRASYLKESISSVLGQTYPDFELIILNDGSTDNTSEIIKAFQDPRIRYLENENHLGYIASINKGASLAKGDWIMFLSDDDVLLPEALATLAKTVFESQIKEIGLVVPQTININSAGKTISVPKLQLNGKEYLVLKPKEFIPNYTLYGKKIQSKYRFNTCFPSTLFKKQVFIEMGGSCPLVPVAHDLLIAAKICLKYPVVVIDQPLIKYRVHENPGVSSGLSRQGKFLTEYLNYLNLLFDFVEKQNIEFGYNFKQYCFDSLIKYLFAVDGGLARLGMRYQAPYSKRLKKIIEYVCFGISQKKGLFLSPSFYGAVLISLLPQKLLFKIARFYKKI
ncbi:glycosyltransferase [Patescibacteria group bacterium]|nr:glycosyltransferase [Patescibacteria group bacterium]